MSDENAPRGIVYPASSIALKGRGILICGASGIGKSALCLLMMDRGAQLISDDQTMLEAKNGALFAAAPPNIHGQLEVRNLGIITVDSVADNVPISLKIILDHQAPRFRESADKEQICGIAIPALSIHPDMALAPLKLEYALQLYGRTIT
jgi:serine kinase of HPr protein (carbohydrate metabolism regulator)